MREAYRQVQENPYQYEDTVVWLLPITNLKVREKIITTSSRTRKPRGKYAGYSVLYSETPNNGRPSKFFRRVFIEDSEGLEAEKIRAGVRLDKCR